MSWGVPPVSDERKRELCAAKVTINGLPATISGIQLDRAWIRLADSGLGAQWSWPTADHVVRHCEGKFSA